MAKQVIIKRLALHNFKGIRNLEVNFSGTVTTISGWNESGKTTIFDAFCWLLFGKDSEGNSDTKFGIKGNDKEGNFIPHLEHSVTGVLEVIDTDSGEIETKTFTRVLVEDWKDAEDPDTGETKEVLKGHHTNYYFNEMPLKTKTEYDKLIADIMPEQMFRLLTSTSYFLNLHWEKQRSVLLDMAGEISDEKIIATNPDFAKLFATLDGKTLEGYQAKLKEDKRKLETELQRIPVRIDEVTVNMPLPQDFEAAEKKLADTKAKQEDLEKAMASAAEASRQAYSQQQELQNKINDLRTKQQNILFAAQQQANDEAHKANEARNDAQRDYDTLVTVAAQKRATYNAEKRRLEADRNRTNERVEEYTRQQDAVRKNWFAVNAEEFADTDALVCPLFKHGCADSAALEAYASNQEQARKAFADDKQTRLASINHNGQQLGEQIKEQRKEEQRLSEELEAVTEKAGKELADLEARQQEIAARLEQAPAAVTARTIKGEELQQWLDVQVEIDKLTKQIADATTAGQADSMQELQKLRQQRDELRSQIEALNAALQDRDRIAQGEARIAELTEQKKRLQQKKAQLQRKSDLITSYEKAKMDEVERRVNGMFKYIKFKLTSQQIEDAKQVADCVCYIDGVRYRDVNNAWKINAGLDMINTLCAFYHLNAPIFIDNAESINSGKIIATSSQLIKLKVAEGDLEVVNV